MSPPPEQNPPRYRTSHRAQLIAAAADSDVLNPHNLADPWYSVWWTTLSDLVEMFDATQSFIVMDNQDILRLSSFGSDDDLAEKLKTSQARSQELMSGQYAEMAPKDVAAALSREKALQEAYIKRQIAAVAREPQGQPRVPQLAIPNGGALRMKPSFVVAHLQGERIDESSSSDPLSDSLQRFSSMGYQMRHQCFPLIGEVKPLPSRRLTGKKHLDMTHATLRVAESDIFDYLALVFARDSNAQKIIAVSAAGICWRCCTFSRSEVPYKGIEDADAVQRKADFLKKFSEAQCHILGTEGSDNELNTLWSTGLSPFLEDHPAYPPA